MCGFVGAFCDRSALDEAAFSRACDMLRHRGPDAFNLFLRPGIALGHQRLSVIDLNDSANQPMVDQTGRVALVHNGEIYNYQHLRATLEARGYGFKTSSDTEVVLAMYLEYGERCVALLQGMFAFAIWDGRTDTLLVARDRFGIKPLYYAHTGRHFIFGSEIKSLLALGIVSPSVNRQALHDFLTFRYAISPHTMFEGIHKLPPAHYVLVSEAGLRFTRYWSLDFSKPQTLSSEEEWIAGFRSALDAAVKRQLVADVPVGLMLSGGLDSSVLATVMQRELRQPLKTFSVSMSTNDIHDERPFARMVAKHVGSEHHELSLTVNDFMEALPAFIWHMDEPVADPASIPLYCLARMAKQHVTVVLSGEGSDELLGGYPFWTHFEGYKRVRWAKRIPRPMRESLIRPLNRLLFRSDRVAKYLDMCEAPLSAYCTFNPEFQDNVMCETEKYRLYEHDRAPAGLLEESVEKVRTLYESLGEMELLDQMLYVSLAQWLPDNLLAKADKMTMAHGLELRVPFLDEQVAELSARMPTNLKIRKQGDAYVVKYALKKAYETVLPREIVERQKLGFPVPYARWMKKEMREMTCDVLLSSSRKGSLWNHREIERLLARALAPSDQASQPLWDPEAKKVWALLVFELWRDAYSVSV